MGAGGRGTFKRSGVQRGNAPRSNQKQNEQTSAVARQLGLTKKQQEELHRLISKEGMSYQEILDFAKEWFNK